MNKKFIGLVPPKSRISLFGNLGQIWEEQENGSYRCINNGEKSEESLTEEDILHDLRKGFLKPYEDEKT